MILVPQQTESKIKNIRNWGCFAFTYIWFVARKFTYVFDIHECEELFAKAVKLGVILDNDLPIKPGVKWWRCYVQDPNAWLRMIAMSIGKVVNPKMIYKITGSLQQQKAPFELIENISAIGLKRGRHATGETSDDVYNPDHAVDIIGIESIRGWEL